MLERMGGGLRLQYASPLSPGSGGPTAASASARRTSVLAGAPAAERPAPPVWSGRDGSARAPSGAREASTRKDPSRTPASASVRAQRKGLPARSSRGSPRCTPASPQDQRRASNWDTGSSGWASQQRVLPVRSRTRICITVGAASPATAGGAVPSQAGGGGEGSPSACSSGNSLTPRGTHVTFLRSARMSEPRRTASASGAPVRLATARLTASQARLRPASTAQAAAARFRALRPGGGNKGTHQEAPGRRAGSGAYRRRCLWQQAPAPGLIPWSRCGTSGLRPSSSKTQQVGRLSNSASTAEQGRTAPGGSRVQVQPVWSRVLVHELGLVRMARRRAGRLRCTPTRRMVCTKRWPMPGRAKAQSPGCRTRCAWEGRVCASNGSGVSSEGAGNNATSRDQANADASKA